MSFDLNALLSKSQGILGEAPAPKEAAAAPNAVDDAVAKARAFLNKQAFQPAAGQAPAQGAPPQGAPAPAAPPAAAPADPNAVPGQAPPVDPALAAQMQQMGQQAPPPAAPQTPPAPEQAPPAMDPQTFAGLLDTVSGLTTALESTRAEQKAMADSFTKMQQEFMEQSIKNKMIMEAIMEQPAPAGDIYGAGGVSPQEQAPQQPAAPQPEPPAPAAPQQNPAGAPPTMY